MSMNNGCIIDKWGIFPSFKNSKFAVKLWMRIVFHCGPKKFCGKHIVKSFVGTCTRSRWMNCVSFLCTSVYSCSCCIACRSKNREMGERSNVGSFYNTFLTRKPRGDPQSYARGRSTDYIQQLIAKSCNLFLRGTLFLQSNSFFQTIFQRAFFQTKNINLLAFSFSLSRKKKCHSFND